MITREAALEAIDAVDDYARMEVGVNAFGPVGLLNNYVAQQEDRIKELEKQLAELAAQNQQLLAVLQDIGDFAHNRSTGPAIEDSLWEVRRIAYETLALPDLASPVLNKVKVEFLREIFKDHDALYWADAMGMADAIEKGEG